MYCILLAVCSIGGTNAVWVGREGEGEGRRGKSEGEGGRERREGEGGGRSEGGGVRERE